MSRIHLRRGMHSAATSARLTSHELNYLLIVLAHWGRHDNWPCVSVSAVQQATGAAERSVRTWRSQLVDKGYVVLRQRGPAGGAEHDLSPLLAQLQIFAREESAP